MLEERYHSALKERGYRPDPAQLAAIRQLGAIAGALTEGSDNGRGGLFGWLAGRPRREPVRGLYLWGGVGRGKTFVMDVFFDAIRIQGKRRVHFHRFMRSVHEALGARRNQSDPLRLIAREWGAELRLLCFDEFFVSDIADAMILGELLTALFAEGVTLVATSNIPPDRLYENGLQRRRFLPAIEVLQAHTSVMELQGATDYRLDQLRAAETWLTPLDDGAKAALGQLFDALCSHARRGGTITLEGRELPVVAVGDGAAWFDFATLCDGPRSASDYLELARDNHTLVVEGIPVLDEKREDAARRFITLVDVLYDHGVNLLVSAATPLAELYVGQRLTFEFERTRSRLIEMRGEAYLHRAHTGQ